MKAYIAASWKHEHAVRMLTALLRGLDIEVISFVEQAAKMEKLAQNVNRNTLEEWINGPDGEAKFVFDTEGATESDLVIYIGPSGTDAWAEVGAAWASGVPVLGLWAKGEQAGLMRRMMTQWYSDHHEMLREIASAFLKKDEEEDR